ncbi:MAG: hypothetical protein HQM09_23035 [Candidatus Riflebacteria bacterium]|nr:hypothetical protein [Candidatus Riflebacteria bacterium]
MKTGFEKDLEKYSIHPFTHCSCMGMLIIVTTLFFMTVPTYSLLALQAYPLMYETSRTLSMGGVSVGIADDRQAMYTNPAGLAQIRDKEYALIQAEGEYNQDYRSVKDKTSGLSDRDTPQDRAANNRTLTSIMGKRAHMEASNLAYYLGTQGFAGAFLYQALAETEVVRPTNPRIRALGAVDSMLSGSLSRPFPGTRTIFGDSANGWWGGTAKFLSRRSLDREYDARDFAGLSEADLRSSERYGAAFDFDAATYWELDNSWHSRVGGIIHNVLAAEIDPSIGNLKRDVAVGVSIRPLSGPPERNKKLLLGADLWNPQDGGEFFSHLRLGGEAWVRPWLGLRAGMRSGWLSAGIEANFRVIRLELSTYGEEIGPRPGDREDRRYRLALGVEF